MSRFVRGATVVVASLVSLGVVAPPSGAASAADAVAAISSVSPTPYIASSNSLTVRGTTTAATDSVAVALTPTTVPATPVSAAATVSSDKSWTATFTASQLGQVSDGEVTVTATSSAAGTAGTPATKTFTKDTTVPAVTAAVSPALMGRTSAGVVATVSGTVAQSSAATAAGEAGDKVTVTADDTDATTAPVSTELTTSGTNGAFTGPLDTASLDDGTITYTYVARDAVGNTSAAVTKTNTKDSTAPAAPTVAVSPDPIANSSKTQVTVSGSASGTTVAIAISDGAHSPVTASAPVSSGSYSKSAIDVSSLNDGTLTVSVTTSDTAGNASPAATTTVVKDTVGPTTTLEVPAFITATTTGATRVEGVSEAGSTIVVKATDSAAPTAASVSGSTRVPADGRWSVLLNTTNLAEGTITFVATGTDTAGNTGASVTKTSTKDVTAPSAPATVKASPTPYSTGTFTVSGTTSTNDRNAAITADVTVTDVKGQKLVSTNQPVTPAGTGGTAGTFSVPFGFNQMSSLAEGALTVSVVFRDAAGNASPATTVAAENGLLRLVSTSPADGATIKPPASVSATYNQVLSSTGTGTTSSITVKNAAGTAVAGRTDISGTTITFTPTAALAAGAYSVTVTAYDKMYPTVSSTDAFSFTADPTAAPAAPVITAFTSPITAANQKTVEVSGTADEAGKPVTVTIGALSKSVDAGTDKTWKLTFDVSSLADGTLTASATQSDGTKSSTAATRTSTKDTAAPAKVSSTPASGATVASASSVVVTFDEALAGTSTLTVAGVTGSSVVDGKKLTFTADNPLPDGSYTATASVADGVGNTGSTTVAFTVDSTPAPTASTVTLTTLPTVVVYGQQIVLQGKVTQTTKAAFGKVSLSAVVSGGRVVDLGEVTVAGDGTWSKVLKPSVNAVYQARYEGDSANKVSDSQRRRTDVAPKVTGSSARGSASTAATIRGTVTPGARGTVVTIYRIGSGGAKVRLGTARLDSSRRYTFKVRLPRGSTRLVAQVSRTADNASGSVTFTATRT